MSRGFACFNAGSSSLKFALFTEGAGGLAPSCRGEVERIGEAPHLSAHGPDGEPVEDRPLGGAPGYAGVLAEVVAWVEAHLAPARLAAVGHRVVHGGAAHSGPALVTPALLDQLALLAPLAPLHQPHNLAPIGAMARLHPGLPQVACFDTAFHLASPRVSRLYALPRALLDQGLLRYGFHGLSYEHMARTLAACEPRAAGRVIAAHLGSGASMCAMLGGAAVASTMGFSALDGLPMATRSGGIDPGLLLYLLREQGMAPAALERMLYHGAGLLGVSGISGDMRTLLASAEPAAQEAVDLFVYRIGRELGSLAAAAGGLDVLVFSGGIGEHAPAIRARVCESASWLGVRLDPAANAQAAVHAGGPLRLHAADSAAAVWMLPADEEGVIARHTRDVVDAAAGA